MAASEFFGCAFDGSMHHSRELTAFYIKYMTQDMRVRFRFFKLLETKRGNAQSVFDALIDALQAAGLHDTFRDGLLEAADRSR